MTDFADARRRMVDSQLRPQGVVDPLVIAAMAAIPREDFLPAPQRALAYADQVVPLGQGRGLNAPATAGLLLNELAPRPGENALLVGAGTGYMAAILARIGCQVTALECDSAFSDSLSRVAGAALATGPLAAGHPAGAPYDLILIDGAVEAIPPAIVAQLRTGGRLAAVLLERGVGRVVIGRSAPHGFGLASIADVGAPALPGFARPAVFTF